MKSNLRIAGATLLTVLYCFAMGSAYAMVNHSETSHQPRSQQELILTDFAHKLICPASTTESSVGNHSPASAPNLKTQWTGFWAILLLTEQRFEASFRQYLFLKERFRIWHTKSDLLFPFHNFW